MWLLFQQLIAGETTTAWNCTHACTYRSRKRTTWPSLSYWIHSSNSKPPLALCIFACTCTCMLHVLIHVYMHATCTCTCAYMWQRRGIFFKFQCKWHHPVSILRLSRAQHTNSSRTIWDIRLVLIISQHNKTAGCKEMKVLSELCGKYLKRRLRKWLISCIAHSHRHRHSESHTKDKMGELRNMRSSPF